MFFLGERHGRALIKMFRSSLTFRGLLVPTLLALKYKNIEFTNTIVALRNQSLTVDRTQFIGFDLRGVVPQFPQLQGNRRVPEEEAEEKEEVSEKEQDEEAAKEEQDVRIVALPQQSSYSPDMRIYEKYRNILFRSSAGEVKVMSYFPVSKNTISWNQNAILFLMLAERELNGKNLMSMDEYTSALSQAGISTNNWHANVSKYFKLREGGAISCSSDNSQSAREGFLDELVIYIDKCIASFEKLLEKYSSEDGTKNISTLQGFCTVASIAFSGRFEIELDAVYEVLTEKKISNSNFISNISVAALKPIITIDKPARKIYLAPYTKLFEALDKHKSFLKQYVGKAKGPIKVSRVEPEIQPAVSKDIVVMEPRYVLGGFGAVVRELSSDYGVFIHAPKSLIESSLDGKRTMVLFCLSALREIGVNEASYKDIARMLYDNRMGSVAMPRDLTLKNDFLIHDKERKSFSSSQSHTAKELLASLVDYKLSKSDITAKMEEILPLMRTIIKENPKGRIERAKLVDRYRQGGIHVSLPRDIPRIFGFFGKEYFYFSPWAFDAAFKLVNTK